MRMPSVRSLMVVGGMASLGSMKNVCFAVVVCRSVKTSLEPRAFGRFTWLMLATADCDRVLESLSTQKIMLRTPFGFSRILAAKSQQHLRVPPISSLQRRSPQFGPQHQLLNRHTTDITKLVKGAHAEAPEKLCQELPCDNPCGSWPSLHRLPMK